MSDKQTEIELEAAAFRRLVAHLQERTDVQNIDMMNLAGFCRNCLSRWYREAADEAGVSMDQEAAKPVSMVCLMGNGKINSKPKQLLNSSKNSKTITNSY